MKYSELSIHSMEMHYMKENKPTNKQLQKRVLLLLKSKKLTSVFKEDLPFSSPGTIARIRDGKFPKSYKTRSKFGLSGLIVPSCPNCGSAYLRKTPKKPKIECIATKKDIVTIFSYVKFFKERESNVIA